MTNIIVQDVGAEKDAITSLRAPTHFGRPNWDRVFSSIAEKHPQTDVGVVRGLTRVRREAVVDAVVVLLRTGGAVEAVAQYVKQVLESDGHTVLLRQRCVVSFLSGVLTATDAIGRVVREFLRGSAGGSRARGGVHRVWTELARARSRAGATGTLFIHLAMGGFALLGLLSRIWTRCRMASVITRFAVYGDGLRYL